MMRIFIFLDSMKKCFETEWFLLILDTVNTKKNSFPNNRKEFNIIFNSQTITDYCSTESFCSLGYLHRANASAKFT